MKKIFKSHFRPITVLFFVFLSSCQVSNDLTSPGTRNVTTLVGSRSASNLSGLSGIAIDPPGNVIVSERESHLIRKINPNGAISSLAGSKGSPGNTDASGSAAHFYLPGALASDNAGNIYVADTGNSLIRKITPAGVVTSLCSLAANGIAVLGPGILVISSGHAVFRVEFNGPNCLVNLLAGDRYSSGLNDDSGPLARFNGPWELAVEPSGSILVADSGNHAIRRVTPQGQVTTVAGGSTAQFYTPFGVAVDASGNIFVADSGNNTIRQIMNDGTVLTIAGKTGVAGNSDGSGSNALFNDPVGLAVNRSGTVYVNDYGNGAIRKLE